MFVKSILRFTRIQIKVAVHLNNQQSVNSSEQCDVMRHTDMYVLFIHLKYIQTSPDYQESNVHAHTGLASHTRLHCRLPEQHTRTHIGTTHKFKQQRMHAEIVSRLYSRHACMCTCMFLTNTTTKNSINKKLVICN